MFFSATYDAPFFTHPNIAGKNTTDEELEEMLESGNPAIFTSGVSASPCTVLLATLSGEGSPPSPTLLQARTHLGESGAT